MVKRAVGIAGIACAAVTCLAANSAAAQDWQTIESSREVKAGGAASVRIEYGAGTIDLLPTNDALLYRMKLKYDAERSQPISTFDEAARSITIGTRSASSNWNKGSKEGSTMRTELSRNVPIRLSMELGAAKGNIQLGGLRLQDLAIHTGATQLQIDVAEPNKEALANFDLDVGAAELKFMHAGNTRARRTSVNVGVGSLDYDLDGAWDGDADLAVNLALGKFTLRLPADAGVRVTASTFLVDFSRDNLEKRGNAWYSHNYDSAKRRVSVSVSAALGEFNLIHR